MNGNLPTAPQLSAELLRIKEYYASMEKVYDELWGDDPHFGAFDTAWATEVESMSEAQRFYTSQLVQRGLAQIPLHRRKERVIILDLCCGKGPIYFDLVDSGLIGDYMGIDLFDDYLKTFQARSTMRIRNKGKQKLEAYLYLGDVEAALQRLASLSDFKNQVDIVFCQDSFYHLRDKPKAVTHIAAVLRPGGIFVVSDIAVNEQFEKSYEWKNHFVERQADSEPLRFSFSSRLSTAFLKQDRQSNYSYQSFSFRTKRTPLHEFSRILRENDFYMLNVIDQSRDLQRSYRKALQSINLGSYGQDQGLIKRTADAFAVLEESALQDRVKLVWWVATKKAATEANKDHDPLLSLTILRSGFRYDTPPGHIILRQLQLDVRRGDYIVIAGQNGSGKTTLLGLMAGVINCGDNVQRILNQGARIAYVEQNPRLFEDLKVESAVELVSTCSDKTLSRKQLVDLLARCNVLELSSMQINKLSGGQRQRTALAIALASSPDVLLLDEPVSAQDHFSMRKIHSLLSELPGQRGGPAVVHVTHRFDELEKEARKRFFEISAGQLLGMQSTAKDPSRNYHALEEALGPGSYLNALG